MMPTFANNHGSTGNHKMGLRAIMVTMAVISEVKTLVRVVSMACKRQHQ